MHNYPTEQTEETNTLTDELDKKILEAKNAITEILSITENYTKQRKEYQIIFQEKENKLSELHHKYIEYLINNPTDEEKAFQEEMYEKFETFFNTMGFGFWTWFWWYDDYEEYYQDYEKEEWKRKDANYQKVNMQEVHWELVDKIGNLTIKEIYRKIAKIIHPDILWQNPEIVNNKEFFDFFTNLFKSILSFYEKEDKWAIIIALQDAGIKYIERKFILPNFKEFKKGAIFIYKQRILEDLLERIKVLKSTSIYAFYVTYKNWNIKSTLQELDDEIEKMQDILSSYEQITKKDE